MGKSNEGAAWTAETPKFVRRQLHAEKRPDSRKKCVAQVTIVEGVVWIIDSSTTQKLIQFNPIHRLLWLDGSSTSSINNLLDECLSILLLKVLLQQLRSLLDHLLGLQTENMNEHNTCATV